MHRLLTRRTGIGVVRSADHDIHARRLAIIAAPRRAVVSSPVGRAESIMRPAAVGKAQPCTALARM
jgi:hypothetical protein